MEREQKLEYAQRVSRKFLSWKGQRHKNTRIHQDTHDKQFQFNRALYGLCSGCSNLKIHTQNSGKYEMVVLHCASGVNIANMYSETPLGEEPICDQFSSINDNAEV